MDYKNEEYDGISWGEAFRRDVRRLKNFWDVNFVLLAPLLLLLCLFLVSFFWELGQDLAYSGVRPCEDYIESVMGDLPVRCFGMYGVPQGN